MPNNKKASSTEEKLAWLRERPELWRDMPHLDEWPFEPEQAQRLRYLRVLMRKAGLYSYKSYNPDVEVSILKHISMLRTILRKETYGVGKRSKT